MKVCGIVAEYNPFHNGHLYHILESKRLSGCEYSICVMSGNFTQRGEAAIVDKWARTRMALAAGADIVIELPVLSALQSAEFFAYGAIKILNALGVITHVCFGSELDDRYDLLAYLSNFFLNEPSEYRAMLKEKLKEGMSFPRAQSQALIEYLSAYHMDCPYDFPSLFKALSSPNNILGIEYIKALKRLGSPIMAVPVTRIHSAYHSHKIKKGISSATAIRKAIREEGLNDRISSAVPSWVYSILQDEFCKGNGPVFMHHFENTILSILRKYSPREIAQLYDVSEGLENRIKKYAKEKSTLEEMLSAVKSKRYVHTRLQRISIYALLGIDKALIDRYNSAEGPCYARVLGFSQKSLTLLSEIKKNSSIPLITKPADFHRFLDETGQEFFLYDILATDLYSLTLQTPESRRGGRDYIEKIILEQ